MFIKKKPVVRWTIGDVSYAGLSCLKRSIRSFVSCYGSDFRMVVCHNNIDVSRLKLEDVELLQQNAPLFDGKGSIWKYTPPRINIHVPELFVDNDIIFMKPNAKILSFFKDGQYLLAKDYIPWYGRYNRLFEPDQAFNAGLFGVPSLCDLKSELASKWQQHGGLKNLTSADEQGLTVLTLRDKQPLVLSVDECATIHSNGVPVVMPENLWKIATFSPFDWKADIFHFVGLNRMRHHHYHVFRTTMI